MPPARRVSRFLEPVVIEISSERRWCISVAVVKPMGTSLFAWRGQFVLVMRGLNVPRAEIKSRFRVCVPSNRNLVALASEIPFTCSRLRLGV